MNGIQFDSIFQRKINQSYSAYYGTAKRDALYAESLVTAIERTYKKLDSQREYDYLQSLISTNQSFNLTNSEILLSAITDYHHLLAIKVKCNDPNWNAVAREITQTEVPNRIKFNKKTALRDGEILYFTTELGSRIEKYVKQKNEYEYYLYDDADFQTSTTLALVNPTIQRRVSYYAKPYFPDQKISLLSKPTIYYPKTEIADSKLKAYPYAVGIIIDYIKTPPLAIVSTGTDELTDYYPEKFLYLILDVAAEIFFEETKSISTQQKKQTVQTDLAGNTLP